MQLILLQKVTNLGNLGDLVDVKPGYGRNFLVPQGKAVPATESNKAEFEAKRAEYEAKAQAIHADADLAAPQRDLTEIALAVNIEHRAVVAYLYRPGVNLEAAPRRMLHLEARMALRQQHLPRTQMATDLQVGSRVEQHAAAVRQLDVAALADGGLVVTYLPGRVCQQQRGGRQQQDRQYPFRARSAAAPLQLFRAWQREAFLQCLPVLVEHVLGGRFGGRRRRCRIG